MFKFSYRAVNERPSLQSSTNLAFLSAENRLHSTCYARDFNELKGCDVFGINFPRDLEVTKKSLLLGATFLIDYNFFERNIKGKRQRQSKTIGPKLILFGIVIVMHVIFFSIIITGYFLQ